MLIVGLLSRATPRAVLHRLDIQVPVRLVGLLLAVLAADLLLLEDREASDNTGRVLVMA